MEITIFLALHCLLFPSHFGESLSDDSPWWCLEALSECECNLAKEDSSKDFGKITFFLFRLQTVLLRLQMITEETGEKSQIENEI